MCWGGYGGEGVIKGEGLHGSSGEGFVSYSIRKWTLPWPVFTVISKEVPLLGNVVVGLTIDMLIADVGQLSRTALEAHQAKQLFDQMQSQCS